MNKTALKAILGISFAMVMLVSVNHIAWAAHSMDNTDNSGVSWVLSYMFALAIDVAIAAISIFLTSKKGWHNKVIGYQFVAGLTLLSWFCNWTFNKEHMSKTGVWTGTVHILWYPISMQWLAPIVLGALPLIGIAFSIMIDYLAGEKMTAAELEAQKLEEQKLQQIKDKYKGKSWIAKGKDRAIEAVSAASEVTNIAKTTFAKQQESERNTDELDFIKLGEAVEETSEQVPGNGVESTEKPERNQRETKEESTPIWDMENLPSWLSGRGRTIRLDEVVKHTNISRKKLNNRVAKHEIRATKNAEIVYKDSLIQWLKDQGILQESVTMPSTIPAGNAEETVQQSEYIDVETAEETMPVLETIEA